MAQVKGDTQLRSMKFNPDGSTTYDLPPKDIKQRTRGNSTGGDVLFFGASGAIDWRSE